MKITISVGGRFHAFNLAHQLEKHGYLQKIITSYPKFETEKYGIPKNKINSIILKELFQRGWYLLPNSIKNKYDPNFFINQVFDNLASKKINNPDIFVGWSNYSLKSLRVAKNNGAIGIIERGSSHIEFQTNILKEEYEKYGQKIKTAHPKTIEKELEEYEEADYISIPSSYVRRTFIEKGISEEKLIQVPYGVDLSSFKQVEKNDDIFRVVFAGGMILRKGVHYLLQAFSELNLPNSELVLFGNISEEIKPFFEKYNVEKSEGQEINKYLNKNKTRIRFLGHVPQKDLHKYYSQGSVFSICSIEEGLALVQPQAMACGLPVVCTTNTGGEDIVRDGKDGFVIPIRNIEKLKEKLLYLYKNPEERNKMSKSAKERVSTGFTWDDYGDKIVKEYERIFRESKNKIII
jgi:glycosyltransferase involved in cell wall biosynthesis